MKEIIIQKLYEIEKQNNVRILLAVESGSRAWGGASPDSDYDVRFIYVRQREDYLRLDTMRDVIEFPINDELDINGWDLQKTLFEWFSSPIVYIETPFADDFRNIMHDYFSKKKTIYHYISMAECNYRDYLKGDTVRAKKYFYVLRPILACKWVLEKKSPPPMLFTELAAAQLPVSLKQDVETLLDLKMNSPEITEINKKIRINEFMDESIDDIKAKINYIDDKDDNDWKLLNALFLSTLHEIRE